MDGADCYGGIPRRKKYPKFASPEEDCSLQAMSDREDRAKKLQSHNEIEKRRRDKMNKYITELSSLLPMCTTMTRKLDKIAVLRTAVQHMKSMRSSVGRRLKQRHGPSFLSDNELRRLVSHVSDGFLFVVSCDRARILFVSESVSRVLNFDCGELLGQSWFSFLHPKDITKIKEQLSDALWKEKAIDASPENEFMDAQNRFNSGTRRSFFCRMKCKTRSDPEASHQKRCKMHISDRRYRIVHCIGYVKSWPLGQLRHVEENDNEMHNLSCLVAVSKAYKQHCFLPKPSSSIKLHSVEFISRCSLDGKFLYVDQRVTLLLGFMPQELVGESCYEYLHPDDIARFGDYHRRVLLTNEPVQMHYYRFLAKNGSYHYFQSKWKAFYNPWNKELEYIVSVNTYVSAAHVRTSDSSAIETSNSNSLDAVFSYLSTGAANSTGCVLGNAGKIGKQIAHEIAEAREVKTSSLLTHVKEPAYLDKMASSGCFEPALQFGTGMSEPFPDELDQNVREEEEGGKGNDEAAMAVIMSLLEADAGLGGPVDFSGLPWPLP